MKILYVHGESIRITGIVNALDKLDVDYEVYPKFLAITFPDEGEIEEIYQYLLRHEITLIVSINLVDNLVLAAKRAGITYLSIIWDAPYLPLFSKYGRMDHCWFSVFDKMDLARFKERFVPHIIYQPLSVDDVAIDEWEKNRSNASEQEYENEICFLGSLYDENFFDEFCKNMPQPLMDYCIDIFEQAAFHWDGTNRVYGTVSDELLELIRRTTPGFYLVNFLKSKMRGILKVLT